MKPLTLLADEPIKAAAFSPDDTTVAILTTKGLTFFDATTGERRRHVDAALTAEGKLENLLWVRPDLLVAWRGGAIQVVTLDDAGVTVKPIDCEGVATVVPSPEGNELLVVDRSEGTCARIVDGKTLTSRLLKKLDEFPMASWSAGGIALWSQVEGKPGRAHLLSPKGEALIDFTTPRYKLATAVGVIGGALAVVLVSSELYLKQAGDKKPKIIELEGDVDPAELRGDLGLAVFCEDVRTVPDGALCCTLPEGWLTTFLSHDGRLALQTDPERTELLVVPVSRQAQSSATTGASLPGLDGRPWALVVFGFCVDGPEGDRVAALAHDMAALDPEGVAVIDGMIDDGLFERVAVGVRVASLSKAPTQRASSQPVTFGDDECHAAKAKFTALQSKVEALLAQHELEVDSEPGFFLVQAGPNASARLTANKGSELREVDDEGKKKKKVEVSYDSTLSTRIEMKGTMTLDVSYL